MKLFTYYQELVSPGIAVKQFHTIRWQGKYHFQEGSREHLDYYIGVGDHDAVMGRLVVSNSDSPEIENRLVYRAIIRKYQSTNMSYLCKEPDPSDNRILLLLRSVEYDGAKYELHRQDDFLIAMKPMQELSFHCMYSGETVTIQNRLVKIDRPITAIPHENLWVITHKMP